MNRDDYYDFVEKQLRGDIETCDLCLGTGHVYKDSMICCKRCCGYGWLEYKNDVDFETPYKPPRPPE